MSSLLQEYIGHCIIWGSLVKSWLLSASAKLLEASQPRLITPDSRSRIAALWAKRHTVNNFGNGFKLSLLLGTLFLQSYG